MRLKEWDTVYVWNLWFFNAMLMENKWIFIKKNKTTYSIVKKEDYLDYLQGRPYRTEEYLDVVKLDYNTNKLKVILIWLIQKIEFYLMDLKKIIYKF